MAPYASARRLAFVLPPVIVVLLGVSLSAASAGAQVLETPTSFDTLGRVQTITPPLVARLRLQPPAWPVTGDFTEARLYAQGAGAYVLIVQRRSGVLERFALTEEQREALRAAVTTSMASAGRPATEERPEIISEPAGNAFARSQTLLAATVYGPALATLIQDPAGSSAGYLLCAALASPPRTGAAQLRRRGRRGRSGLIVVGAAQRARGHIRPRRPRIRGGPSPW